MALAPYLQLNCRQLPPMSILSLIYQVH